MVYSVPDQWPCVCLQYDNIGFDLWVRKEEDIFISFCLYMNMTVICEVKTHVC